MIAIKRIEGIIKEFKVLEDSNLPEGFDELITNEDWEIYLNSLTTNERLTKEYIHKKAKEYQDMFFDDGAVSYLSNVKFEISLSLGLIERENNLAYQMIKYCERFINRIWSLAFLYDSQENYVVLDFENEIGNPLCSFRDIEWILDENSTGFRLLEPDREVNLDINFYKNN